MVTRRGGEASPGRWQRRVLGDYVPGETWRNIRAAIYVDFSMNLPSAM